MVKFKFRLVSALCAVLMFVPALPVSATEAVPVVTTSSFTEYELHPSADAIKNRPDASLNASQFNANYTKQMGSGNALQAYMINAQPSDAILFNSGTNTAVVCTATPTGVDQSNPRGVNQLSVNYKQGALDLPRLDARYYYNIQQVDSNMVNAEEGGYYGFSVKRTLYPTLTWTSTVPSGTQVILAVCSADTNAVLRQVTVRFESEQPGLESTWQDCSAYVLQDALDPAYGSIYRTAGITWYPAELHRSCIVTSQFIVGHNDIWGPGGDDGKRNTFGFFIKTFNTSSGSNTSVQSYLALHPVTKYTNFENRGYATDVKGLVYPYIRGNSKPEYFAVFMPHGQGVIYNSNRGTVTTGANNAGDKQYDIGNGAETYKGVYALCYGDNFDVFTIASREFTGDLVQIDDSSAAKTVDNGSDFNIEEAFGKFGYRRWADTYADLGFDIESYPTIKYTGQSRNTYNVYNTAMAYGGVIPHVARVTFEAPIEHYTVTTWYNLPGNTSSQMLKCEELSIPLNGQAPSLKSPTEYVAMYTFDRWYTDQACTVPADMNTIHQKAKANDSISLYGKYNYTGGTYTVQFYNDATGESSSATFECREKPTLPPTPTRSGYLFRNWQEVYNTASTSGTPYDPQTFAPQKDRNYIFKTFWDVEGVITNVSSNQNEYYVGDSIDKSKVVVTVQTDNNGTTRTLSTDEFTVSPDTVNSAGRNQIQVTYIATGATATFDVTGRAVQPVSLTARYNGSSLNVGATVSRSNITCIVNYNNGKSETVTDFTIAPTTIANAGANTIRVIYGSLSTTVTVTGNRPSGGSTGGTGGGGSTTRPPTPTNPTRPSTGSGSTTTGSGNNSTQRSRLTGITAYYTGSQPYVGDVLKASDITVTATYQDGSTTTLSSTAFQFSPSYVRNSGDNTITVSYGGLATTFTVSALLQSDNTVTNGVPNTNNTSTGSVTGVDENGNPIYSGAGSTGATSTGTVTSSGQGTILGNPLTGAGISSSEKGTSTGYLNGSNILASRLYGGATSVTNTLDIMSEINAAGDTASSVDIELLNGAAGNDITGEMLQALKDKDLVLNIRMLNPDDKSTMVGYWSILGGSVTDTSKQFNPNISFEVTEKGAETLTYMAIADGEYPDSTSLRVYPALATYDSGELIRIYSCGFDKSDAHLVSLFTWSDVNNDLEFDFVKSKRYALSNAADAYEEGASLLTDISRPSELDVEEGEDLSEEGDSLEGSDEEEEFDWGDDDTSANDQPEEPKKKFPIGLIIAVIGAILFAGCGAVCFVLLRRRSSTPTDDSFDDYGQIPDEDEFEENYADDELSFSDEDEDDDSDDGIEEEEES